jgi:acyl dehydratase
MDRTEPLYLDDLEVGQRFRSGVVAVTAGSIKAFAAEFDPQPFHLDEGAAAASFFGGLVASGWQTACLTMRLLVEGELQIAGGLIGAGVEEMRWPRPVRPGETLQAESELIEIRVSEKRPDRGIVRIKTTTLNQDGLPVLEQVARLVVPRRPS